VSLSKHAVEATVGNAKGRIEAGSRLAEVAEGLRGLAQAQEEGQAVVLKGTRRSLGSGALVGARGEMPSVC